MIDHAAQEGATKPAQKAELIQPVSFLADGFFDAVEPASFPQHIIRYRNESAARNLGLADLDDQDWKEHFAAFMPFENSLGTPLAQRYHGHQFRHYNPEIGDGRGFLFAQIKDTYNRVIDLTTKGSGTTPYSRRGDGRLTLKGAVREILATEMLEALGAETSKTLSVVETGESLYRGDEPSPTRSAVLVRACHGSIRIGTFQYHAYHSDKDRLETLVTYCLDQYFGGTQATSAEDKALDLLDHVTHRAARNAADLMISGFVHGVLNSDNINITGEIFDFGPWRFLPVMDPDFTAAYFDETGLYAYGRQPEALHWNLYQFAGTLLDLAKEKPVRAILEEFPERYSTAFRDRFLKRLGIKSCNRKDDAALVSMVHDFLIQEKPPYEQFFYDWYGGGFSASRPTNSPLLDLYQRDQWQEMISLLNTYTALQAERCTKAYFHAGKPCTMLIDEVEALWHPIADRDDWSLFHQKLAEINRMKEALA